jgi:hypothetical protein
VAEFIVDTGDVIRREAVIALLEMVGLVVHE